VYGTIEATAKSNLRRYMAMSSKGVFYPKEHRNYNPGGYHMLRGSVHYALQLKFGKTGYPDPDKFSDPTDADINTVISK
jgi:hypothetical protein